MGETSFADTQLPLQVGRNARLGQLHEIVGWDRLAAVVGDLCAAPEGRPSYPSLLLVSLLRQQ